MNERFERDFQEQIVKPATAKKSAIHYEKVLRLHQRSLLIDWWANNGQLINPDPDETVKEAVACVEANNPRVQIIPSAKNEFRDFLKTLSFAEAK